MTQNHSQLDTHSEASEAVIVGGSAAGLFTAYLLARAGRRVRLFDANDVQHTTARTLITTARLSEVLGFFPEEAVVNEIKEIELFSRRRAVTIPMRQPDLVVERSAIVRLLANKALEAGVEICGGCKFLDLEPAERGVTVTIQDTHRNRIEKVNTATLVGADGAFSRVARIGGTSDRDTTPILQAIVNLPEGARKNTTQVWFEPEDTPYFYWLIPESQTQAAVGFVAEEGRRAKRHLERFLSRHGLKPIEMQAARIPAYAHSTRLRRRIFGTDVHLVGDAASQVKVTTVGGLVTGLRGARAAAAAILRQRDSLKEAALLRGELSLHLLIRTVLNRFRSADYDRLLGLLNEKTIRLLGICTRDQAALILWKILWTQPRFLTFAAVLARGLRHRSPRQRSGAPLETWQHDSD